MQRLGSLGCTGCFVLGQQLHLSEVRRVADQGRSTTQRSAGAYERVAKIAGIKLREALRQQQGFDAMSLKPANLYGPGDNYHPINSHVLPLLIRRFHEAVEASAPSASCWGTGSTLREFLHVDDLSEACVFAQKYLRPAPGELTYVNVGTGIDMCIRELVKAVATATSYQGAIKWDSNKYDSTPKKHLDVSCMSALDWGARVSLEEGLASTFALFRESLGAA